MGFLSNMAKGLMQSPFKNSSGNAAAPLGWDRWYAEHPGGLALYGGMSTGTLSTRNHKSGIHANQRIWIKNDECCQNFVALGPPGSGKTTGLINPLLYQLLQYHGGVGGIEDVGGLIFDVKADFVESVESFSVDAERDYIKIGVGEDCRGVNLLKGLEPEQAAAFFQSLFYSVLGDGSSDKYWSQAAIGLCKNVLGLMQSLDQKYYNLDYLYQYIFFPDIRQAIDEKIDALQLDPLSREHRKLQGYRKYYQNVYSTLDEKMRKSIEGTLMVILEPFQSSPELIDAFSSDDNDYDLTNILRGDVVLVDLPLARWGMGAKVIYTFIKLRFFNLLQMRQADKEMPQNYVFYCADEYQDLISADTMGGLSDLNFWSKSRSAKVIGIFGMQGMSSVLSVIKNPAIVHTILMCWRQRYFLRPEDSDTIRYINDLLGKVDTMKQTRNVSFGESQSNFDWLKKNDSQNVSYHTSIVERQIVDASLLRGMQMGEALALLNVDGEAADDVVHILPKFP